MEKNNKKYFLLCLGLMSAFCLAGCAGKQPALTEVEESTVTNTQSHYSRAEWIQRLGDTFGYVTYQSDSALFSDVQASEDYYAEVQACSEWEVITDTGDFFPKEAVTWEYALDTAVRAIGIEELTEAGYDITGEGDLPEFYLENIASVEIADLNEYISEEEAEQVLTYAYEFENNLVFTEVNEITYQEGVKTISDLEILLRGDGESAYVVGEDSYDVGQVLLYSSTQDGKWMGLKVSSVDDNLIYYTEADLSEIFSEINVRGSFDPDSESINISRANWEIMNANAALNDTSEQGQVMNLLQNNSRETEGFVTDVAVESNVGRDSADFTVNGDGWTLSAGVKNVRATGECKFTLGVLKEAGATLSFDDYVHGDVSACLGKSFPLGTMSIPLDGGANVVRVQVDLVLNVGADGQASIDYVSHVAANVQYRPFKGTRSSLNTTGASLDFHAEITATAEPTIRASLMLLDTNILNIQGTTGLVAIAKADVDLLEKQPNCVDIYAYVPLRWAFNEKDSLVRKLLGKKAYISKTVWNADYSAITWEWHYEDGIEVNACTRGAEEKVKASVIDETGEFFNEEETFEFQPVEFDTIGLESSMMFLTKDETLKIGFKEIPQGYTTAALVYEVVDNQEVCQANGDGTITGCASGAANIKISTPDDLYHAYITVIVQDDYSMEFNPL